MKETSAVRERVRQILEAHQPEPLDEALERENLALIESYEQQEGDPTDG
jgi:hypothetical protein